MPQLTVPASASVDRKAIAIRSHVGALALVVCASLSHHAIAGVTAQPLAGGGLVHWETARTVSISGQASLFGGDPFQSVEVSYARTLSGDLHPAELRAGMALRLPEDQPLGWGGVDGQARQWLDTNAGGLSFNGLADVFASGGTSDWGVNFEGQGRSQVQLMHRFELLDSRPMQLRMDSTVGQWRDDDYRFALRYIDPKGGPAHTVWQDTVVYDDDWRPSRDFSRVIELKAGGYELEVSLNAASWSNGNWQTAGRTLASFSLQSIWRDGGVQASVPGMLSPVPEPSTIWLVGIGLLALATHGRRRTTSAPDAQAARC